MRRWMTSAAIGGAIACGVIAVAGARTAPMGVGVGDVLVYDVTVEAQMHTVPSPGSAQPALSRDSTVVGTETITGLSADRDGSVHASVHVSLRGDAAGQPMTMDQSVLVKIAPDGTTHAEGGSAALGQYIDLFGGSSKALATRTLHVGDVFHQTIQGMTGFVAPVVVTSKVVGEKAYRGYPTFAITSAGSGKFDASQLGASAAGNVTTAGTTYYDQADALLIGVAQRTDMEVHIAQPQGGELSIVATTNLVLASRTRGGPASATGATKSAGSPAPSPTTSASPAPTVTPTQPDEYYTPTPAAPTPSPVVVPYPQHT